MTGQETFLWNPYPADSSFAESYNYGPDDGSSLTGWTNNHTTVDVGVGNPAPSFFYTLDGYFHRDSTCSPTTGYTLQCDLMFPWTDAGRPVVQIIFGNTSAGIGPCLVLDARAAHGNSGFRGGTAWGSDGGPQSGSVYASFSTGIWYTIKIVVKPGGTTASWYINGVLQYANASLFYPATGSYIGFEFYTGGSEFYIDNITVGNVVDGGYTSFCPNWTPTDSYNLLPMAIVGVVSGGAGPATWDGTAYAPWTPNNVGSWGQASWSMTQCGILNVAVEDDYTFKVSSKDACVIGIAGATRVSGDLVFNGGSAGRARVMTKTASQGYPVVFAHNVDWGQNPLHASPHPPNPYSDLRTFVVRLTVGLHGIELDYGCHVDDRTVCLNWMMNGVQSPILPVSGAGVSAGGADPAQSPFGFLITDQKDGRAIIKDLQDGFFFDPAESDFKLKFVQRGVHPSVMMIPQDDLGLLADTRAVKKTVTQDQDAPRLVVCNYLDPSLDYQQGTQHKMRSSRVVTSLNETTLDLTALALSQTLARQIAEKTLYTTWMERQPYEMNLWKAAYALLDATDTVDFVVDDVVYQQRLKSLGLGQDFSTKLEGVSQLAAAYASAVVGVPFNPALTPVAYPWLMLESGDFVLLEDGTSKILMENTVGYDTAVITSGFLVNGV